MYIFIYFIYTVLIERAIHNSMCSNALIHNYERYTQLYIEERETSGILLNHISDHQLLFTYIEKLSYIERVPKYIDVEKADTISIAKFVKELNDGNIYDQLLKPIDSNPHENYDTFMKIMIPL